jgi:hypothetical protein
MSQKGTLMRRCFVYRSAYILGIILVLCSVGSASQPTTRPAAHAPSDDFKLTIDAKSRYGADEPIYLEMVIRNVNGPVVNIVILEPSADYDVKVVGPAGKDAPPTLYADHAKRAADLGLGPIVILQLAPTHELPSKMQLNRYFDMTLDGDYTVTVSRKLRPVASTTQPIVVRSNELKIHVGSPVQK